MSKFTLIETDEGHIDRLDEIGNGVCSVVYSARWNDRDDEKNFAIKIFKETIKKEVVDKTLNIVNKLEHEHVIRFIGSPLFGHLIFELAERDLAQFIKSNPDQDDSVSFTLVIGFFAGLAYLHNKQIAHRDIKPNNIFITEGNIAKIGDFSHAWDFSEGSDTADQRHGTYPYLSPDAAAAVLDETALNETDALHTDLYAGFITAYETVHRTMVDFGQPFSLVNRVFQGTTPPVDWEESPTIFAGLFSRNVDDRPSAHEIASALETATLS